MKYVCHCCQTNDMGVFESEKNSLLFLWVSLTCILLTTFNSICIASSRILKLCFFSGRSLFSVFFFLLYCKLFHEHVHVETRMSLMQFMQKVSCFLPRIVQRAPNTFFSLPSMELQTVKVQNNFTRMHTRFIIYYIIE
jgi:hypothetical protein